MERWILTAGIAAVCFGGYNIFTRLASGRMPDIVGAFWLEASALIAMLVYMAAIRQPLLGGAVSRGGLLLAIGGGLCVAVGTALTFTVFRQGGPLSTAGTIIQLGIVIVITLAGVFALDEPLTGRRVLGWGFALASIWLLAK
jgi:drug/metabolite transporter (DMT)-like permease